MPAFLASILEILLDPCLKHAGMTVVDYCVFVMDDGSVMPARFSWHLGKPSGSLLKACRDDNSGLLCFVMDDGSVMPARF